MPVSWLCAFLSLRDTVRFCFPFLANQYSFRAVGAHHHKSLCPRCHVFLKTFALNILSVCGTCSTGTTITHYLLLGSESGGKSTSPVFRSRSLWLIWSPFSMLPLYWFPRRPSREPLSFESSLVFQRERNPAMARSPQLLWAALLSRAISCCLFASLRKRIKQILQNLLNRKPPCEEASERSKRPRSSLFHNHNILLRFNLFENMREPMIAIRLLQLGQLPVVSLDLLPTRWSNAISTIGKHHFFGQLDG